MNRYDLVLLGMIKEQSCSGYDIITLIKKRELDKWAKISTSTVYNRLAYLQKNGFITGQTEKESNRPERTIFSITAKGSDLLKKEIVAHLTGFNDDPRTLGYAFLYGADHLEVAENLEVHVKKLERELKKINKMIDEEPRPTLFSEGPFLNCMSRDHLMVEVKYAKEAIRILKDPEKSGKINGFFYLNFGNRDFQR
ncbi:MAG: PadR family transcriptional regulator [Fibrobacter sp.]|nr:PadR family transcriptional regulator [Fibrobacter sp.]